MVIDDTLLNKLEKLSALQIPEEKREDFKKQLGEIVNFTEILNELNLDGLDATISAASGGTPLRDDISQESNIRDLILTHAPKSQDGYFVVPKIIE